MPSSFAFPSIMPPQGALALVAVFVLGSCSKDRSVEEPRPDHTVVVTPNIPAAAVFPSSQLPIAAGTAFSASVSPGQTPLLLTAKHLLATAALTEADSPSPIEIPLSAPLGVRTAAGDIAALPLPNPEQTAALDLSTEIPADVLWIATPEENGSLAFHEVSVMAERGGNLYYRIPDTPTANRLGSNAGAPVVDAAGRAVALHLGTAQDDDGSHFGIANPVSRFLPHLLAALPKRAVESTQLAGQPADEANEITGKD